ncbi:hypothetical protein GC194_10945 [bacterium]|nr:hypothetical protein [bacterium]
MKNVLTLILASLLFSNSSVAQCKLYSKTDQFDGSVVHWTKPVKIANGGIPGILKGPGNSDCSFKITLHFVSGGGKKVLVITEDQESCDCSPVSISLKLSNNAVISKSNVRFGKEQSRSIRNTIQYSYFDLTEKELLLLSQYSTTRFRIQEAHCTDHPVFESNCKAKVAEKIKENAKCIAGRNARK